MWQYGICFSPFIPIRKTNAESSEMTSQLLFGDLVIINQEVGNWFEIIQEFDNYKGWVDKKEIKTIEKNEYQKLKDAEAYYCNEALVSICDDQSNKYIIGMGSTLYNLNTGSGEAKFAGENLYLDSNDIKAFLKTEKDQLIRICKGMLNTSYLWGGKSFFGIDCSGLVQSAFKSIGISLPRNSGEQSELGLNINFLSEAESGDLVFFDNEDGIITHVGILIDQETIIHASGKVRIDKIDHHGIYKESISTYTHQLRLIKRLL